MTPRARRAWLLFLFLASLVLGALLEYAAPPPPDAAISLRLLHEACVRLLYAGAAAVLCALAPRLPGRGLCPARLARWVLVLAMAVAVNNFPIATLLVHRTASVSAGAGAILALGLACLATALLEELLFRGFLLPLCLARWGGRRGGLAAVLLSSAAFGACHLLNLLGGAGAGETLLQVGYSFLIGCLCAALCCLYGRLLPAVLLHAVYNFGGYLVPRLGSGPLYDTPTVVVTVLLALGSAAVTALAIWLNFSTALPETIDKNHKNRKKT